MDFYPVTVHLHYHFLQKGPGGVLLIFILGLNVEVGQFIQPGAQLRQCVGAVAQKVVTPLIEGAIMGVSMDSAYSMCLLVMILWAGISGAFCGAICIGACAFSGELPAAHRVVGSLIPQGGMEMQVPLQTRKL